MLIKKDPAVISGYLEDSSNLKGGHAEELVIPDSTAEVSSILKEANSKKIPVTVSGAGTGQAGARIPFGGIILSTEKLNIIEEIKKVDDHGIASVGAGVLIQDLKDAADKKNLFYTYDPTEQTAFVGGTIATNASGAKSFRYGPTRKFVNALSIVLADGTIFHLRRGEIKVKKRALAFETPHARYKINLPTYKMPKTKNSAGYFVEDDMDLIDLFIGQEGTIGVIAEAELALFKKPKEFFSMFVFFKDESKVLDFVESARRANPLSIEYFDKNSLNLLKEKYHKTPDGARSAIFFEDEITESEDKVVEKWEKILSSHGISFDDTWVAMNEERHREFLDMRHFIPETMSEAAKRSGFQKVSTDLAVPLGKSPEMLKFYKKSLNESSLRHFIFGHIGDAHLHVNMLPKDEKDYEKAKRLQLEFVKKSVSLGGTVSAEHGIGKQKKDFLKILYGKDGVTQMQNLKKELDPNLILGRGNIFDVL